MKNLKLIGFLMILVSSLMFIQCTSEPIAGPQGQAGIDGTDGIDGVDGVDGVDGTASCIACHSESHRTPIINSFAKSSHSDQTIMYTGQDLASYTNGVSASCTKCHTSEGYINYIEGKPAVKSEMPSGVSCTTCHSKHSTFDFENDGHDYALRTMEAVTLDTDDSYTIDYGNASNSCLVCHQPRSKAPVDDGTGMYLQASSRFYPHYGGQSTVLEGIQGSYIEVDGAVELPAIGTSAHRTGASCTSCHMGTSTDAEKGLHTFKVSLDSCTDCHGATPPTEVAGLADDMAVLKAKLIALGLLDEAGNTPKQTEKVPFKQVQALWNYVTVYKDGSHGVHNPTYTKALITNALKALEDN